MVASDIISQILQRYKMLCAKYPQSPSFIPNTKGDSFYLISNRGEGLQPIQIRLSNHGTYLETWCDRNELGDSVERLNPALCVNISIVFVDEGEDLTKDCKGMSNCEGCEIEPCKPQTFEGQDQIGRPFTVIQYVYSSKCIRRKYINGLTKAIAEASTKGKYIDPLADLYRAAKDKEFHSSTKLQNNKGLKPENKQYKRNTNMNKKLIRLTESDLHRIVKESVNRVLREGEYNFASGTENYDVNSDEWKTNYDRMSNDYRGQEKKSNLNLMDLQIAHHNGMKGRGGYNGELSKTKQMSPKGKAESIDTIISSGLRRVNGGISPSEAFSDFKPFSEEEKQYYSDDMISQYYIPIGTVYGDTFMLIYDTKKEKYIVPKEPIEL